MRRIGACRCKLSPDVHIHDQRLRDQRLEKVNGRNRKM